MNDISETGGETASVSSAPETVSASETASVSSDHEQHHHVSADTSVVDTYDTLVKCAIIGNVGTGKSTLVYSYTKGPSDDTDRGIAATVGVEFSTKCSTTKHGNVIKFQLWDASGDEKYRPVLKKLLQGITVVLMTFSVLDSQSFSDLKAWYEFSQTELNNTPSSANSVAAIKPAPETVYVIVANKIDMKKTHWQVKESEIVEYAEQYDIPYYMTSALTGKGIDSLFEDLAIRIETQLKLPNKTTKTERNVSHGCCSASNETHCCQLQCNMCNIL